MLDAEQCARQGRIGLPFAKSTHKKAVMHRLILCLFVLLTACGGGSQPATNTPPPPAATSSISGAVTAPNGTALPGVLVSLSGAASSSTVANANGAYSFTGLANGNYVVTPSAAEAAFTPSSAAVNIQGQPVSAVNFARTPQSYASTQLIVDYMAILHSQMQSAFVTADGGALNSLGAGGPYLRASGRAYVSLVQGFTNDSLAFVSLRSQAMAIDYLAIAALFSAYASQDASYANTFYRDVCARLGLPSATADSILADVIPQVANIYALAILQLPSLSRPSTETIANAMTILHAQMLFAFAENERGIMNRGDAFGFGGPLLRESTWGYVEVVQKFVNDSLAFVNLKRQSMPIDAGAVAALFSTYASQDAAYADTYYHGTWAQIVGSAAVNAVLPDAKKSLSDIFTLAISQLQ